MFDKNEMTAFGKGTIVKQFDLALGKQGLVNQNLGNPIKPFIRNWGLDKIKVSVSDVAWNLGSGESLNVFFGYY